MFDGATLAQAEDGLEKCFTSLQGHTGGAARDYRILLAMRRPGDGNDSGFVIVGVKNKPKPSRVICTVKGNGVPAGSSSDHGTANSGAAPVRPDKEAIQLYAQLDLAQGHWKLPFHWAGIGSVDDSVTRVTVSYGGRTSRAVLDHGWFAATGTLTRQVTATPHVKGYDADGKLVYDSDRDKDTGRRCPDTGPAAQDLAAPSGDAGDGRQASNRS
ncbi:hypothetical protein [Streptomyces sp. MK7]|uniref:hypothetical protein n=1 Tax=Streptomyces sp. MK7 TaxID=3067635 RepID=UPI00292E2CBF|nr:hypothetical protein [Streptomyces sp. MK7]